MMAAVLRATVPLDRKAWSYFCAITWYLLQPPGPEKKMENQS